MSSMSDFARFVRIVRAEYLIPTQVLAREARVEATRMSRIALGHVQPTPEEKARILDAIERLKAWRMQNPYA